MPRNLRMAWTVALAIALSVALVGCQKPQPKPEPKVAPPVIGEAGVLRAGVDFASPPFAGKDQGQDAGIDVDVAAAIAGKLGLQLKLVDVAPERAADALKAGQVDLVTSVSLSEKALANASIAGTYLDDAPVVFGKVDTTASIEPSLTISSLGTNKVGAQKGSAAYWLLAEELGEDGFKAYPTLREAFQGAANGDVAYIAGDAITGSYIARDFPGYRIVGQVGPATRIGIAVAPENEKLSKTVRATLDTMAADGVLDTIREKWVGDMPDLKLK